MFNKEYEKIILEHHNNVREVTVIVTPHCRGGCRHCLYYRDRIGDREWDLLWEQVVQYYGSLDPEKHWVISAIEGGELFADELVVDNDYVRNLERLVDFLYKMSERANKWYLALSVSLENIGKRGIAILKELKDRYPWLRVNIAFSFHRFTSSEKVERFWRNLNILSKDDKNGQVGMGVLMTEGFPERKLLKKFIRYAKSGIVDFAEPHQFDGNAFSYEGINATKIYEEELSDFDNAHKDPALRRMIPSFHHLDIYVTSKGVLNGFHLLRRPSWVSKEEWNKIRDDEEYRLFGYQQVLDWYGCNNCKWLFNCQGMLWTSYYAQRRLFRNNKCLYGGVHARRQEFSGEESRISS